MLRWLKEKQSFILLLVSISLLIYAYKARQINDQRLYQKGYEEGFYDGYWESQGEHGVY
jgi:hypothetical protein